MATYVERDNEIIYRAPYLQRDAFLSTFFLSSPRAAQQAILDRDLNALISGTPYRYTAVLDHVWLILADIGQVSSLAPIDANKGWVAEKDVCWWILASAEKDGEHDHFALHIPYIWVDNAYTLVSGRESFGFPKSFAWPRVPKDEQDLDGPFWADALVLPTYTPETEVQRKRILDITRGKAELVEETVSGLAAFERIVRRVVGNAVKDTEIAVRMTEQLLSGSMQAVYLKQFRDVVDPGAACYQAVIESNFTVHGFHGASLLPFGFEIQTHPMASVDVGEHLGFGTSAKVEFGIWAKLDFSVDLGRVVWSAR